jgi:hypothetical protein
MSPEDEVDRMIEEANGGAIARRHRERLGTDHTAAFIDL